LYTNRGAPHWSRQWEYPFVYANIQLFIINDKKNSDIKILDAGSGVIFFPYYIASTFDHIEVHCCNIDVSLKSIFSNINANSKFPVNFYSADIHYLPFKDNSYDIVYCISVLEHAKDFEAVIREFKRVLKQNGLLIVTFDISVDGLADISVKKGVELIKMLEKYFCPIDNFNLKQDLDRYESSNYLCIESVKRYYGRKLFPRQSFYAKLRFLFKNILKFHTLKTFSNLTVYCITFKKKR